MDAAQVDENELADDQRNLAWFNRLFGGIAVIRAHLPRRIRCSVLGVRCSVFGLRGAIPKTEHRTPNTDPAWTVLDVATGGGDIPRWLARRKELDVELLAA